jgi:hypothetical protein
MQQQDKWLTFTLALGYRAVEKQAVQVFYTRNAHESWV